MKGASPKAMGRCPLQKTGLVASRKVQVNTDSKKIGESAELFQIGKARLHVPGLHSPSSLTSE